MAETDADDIFPNPDTTIKFSNNSDTFLDEETPGTWLPELGNVSSVKLFLKVCLKSQAVTMQ